MPENLRKLWKKWLTKVAKDRSVQTLRLARKAVCAKGLFWIGFQSLSLWVERKKKGRCYTEMKVLPKECGVEVLYWIRTQVS